MPMQFWGQDQASTIAVAATNDVGKLQQTTVRILVTIMMLCTKYIGSSTLSVQRTRRIAAVVIVFAIVAAAAAAAANSWTLLSW